MAAMNVHQAKDGTKPYRVRVRRKGPTVQTASLPSMKDVRIWATMIATEIIAGKHFPASKPRPTPSALLDRYVQEIMPLIVQLEDTPHRRVRPFHYYGRYRLAQLPPEAEMGDSRLVLQQGADDHDGALPAGEDLTAGQGQGRILGVGAGECQ